MERDISPEFTVFYDSVRGNAAQRRRLSSICPLCNNETREPITISCGHIFCWTCYSEDRASMEKYGYSCPACINQKPDEPLQLVSVDESGLLVLQERVLYRCFLSRRIDKYPVYVISVIGERRTGKSFLMNYLIKALQSQETAKKFDLGAEDEILNGFTWKPGPDKVTLGIWIWSKPFILERNGQKVAVFLLDTEGSMDMEGDRKANIKMCMLNMLLSSHLVYNVNSSIKETDIDYLEIYCHGIGSDKRYKLKYFDFLIRNWYDPKKCETNDAGSYINKETEEFVSYLNDLKYNISSPSEMYNMGKNQEHMEKIKNEFREFLNSWPMWRLRIGDTVANKISELQQKFKESFIYINEDDRKDQKEKLREYLVTEGDKFCRNHNTKLLLNGIPALVSLAAAPAGAFMAATTAVANPSTVEMVVGAATAGVRTGWALVRRFI
ncbi:RING finger protein 112-like isoform X5 [Bufo bufo]|uniref:RING finger protein 112-like isoform X5 n=1 Tax=Bufo bufo TaxID=8384 RepID=UPI001ABE0E3F|nr:RING finger protein 112-like isoform X5 [Bufo bufo]